MKRIVFLALATFAATLAATVFINRRAVTHAQTNTPDVSSRATADKEFERVADEYIEQLLRYNPETATQLGDHRFDDKLNDYTLSGIARNKQIAQTYLTKLADIKPAALSQVNNIDYRILKNELESQIFAFDTLREYEWNPLNYNPGNAIYALVARDFAPLRVRLLNVKARLEQVPAVLQAARTNLKNPPRIHTETAIIQNQGNIALVTTELNAFLDKEPDLKAELAPVQARAAKAFEEYGKWLKNDLLPISNGDFRIGAAKYDAKLRYVLDSQLTKEEILQRATQDLKRTQQEMYQTAVPLYRKFYPSQEDAAKLSERALIKAVLDKLAEARPTNETIVAKADETLKATTDFVRANKLVSVPDEPIKIIVMPEFARGTAVAYCDAAGALEKNAATFYAISPTPADWTRERVESFFKEYNNYMLEDLTIHEAMPGHYLQLAHANRFKAPTRVRALFSSGSFVEGWAVYSEALMAEKGYGGAAVKMQQLKMRLRVIINSIIDQRIHTAGMTEKEAVDFMMREGFQEEGEAAGKWRRANLSSTQLSTYYIGSLEVADLRRDYERKMGAKFNLQQTHDLMLSFGSPAAKYVREMMKL